MVQASIGATPRGRLTGARALLAAILGLAAPAVAGPLDLTPISAALSPLGRAGIGGLGEPLRLAQAAAPDPTYAGLRTLRLAIDLVELPNAPAQACGVDLSGVTAAVRGSFAGTGIQAVGPGPAANFSEAERAAPELGIVAIVLASPDRCDIVLQGLLAAPVTGARMTATGAVFNRTEAALWTHASATRRAPSEAGRDLPAIVRDALGDLVRDIMWANAPAGSSRPALPGERVLYEAPPIAPPATPPVRSIAACPERWRDLGASVPARLDCACTGAALAGTGSVWGTGVYTDDSALCRAALHAGVVGANGGTVRVLREGGRDGYAGSVRNGVSTSNYGAWTGSFRFEAPGAPPVRPAGVAPAPAFNGAKPPPAPAQGGR